MKQGTAKNSKRCLDNYELQITNYDYSLMKKSKNVWLSEGKQLRIEDRPEPIPNYEFSNPLHSLISFRSMIYCLFCLLLSGYLNAQNVQTLEAQRKAVLEEMEATTSLLSEIRASTATSLNRLNLLSSQVQTRKNMISLLNQEIATIDKDMIAMNQELIELEKDLKGKREKYATSVQSIYARHSSQYKWLFVLSTHNFSQILNRMRYVREYATWQQQQGTLILRKQEEINRKQLEIEQSRAEKVELLNIREEETKKLQKEEAAQRAEVQQLNRRQSALQTEITRQRNLAAALNREIERLITNDNKRSNNATTSRTPTTAGSYRMNTEEQKLAGDFASNKGLLPFPVSGKYRIVRPFGEYQYTQYVRLKNDGIDIQTTAGTVATAVFEGVVTSVFRLPGSAFYSVILRHGNYLTLYTYLSEVYVKNGDKVSTNQRLGKILTDTKNDNATILHFELRNERETLNPVLWLKSN